MSRPVHWSAIAVEHLAGIVKHIGQSSPTYAERMADRILARVDVLGDFPEIGRLVPEARDDDIREIIERPYRIIYLAQPTRVDVLAIVHGRQQIDWPG